MSLMPSGMNPHPIPIDLWDGLTNSKTDGFAPMLSGCPTTPRVAKSFPSDRWWVVFRHQDPMQSVWEALTSSKTSTRLILPAVVVPTLE